MTWKRKIFPYLLILPNTLIFACFILVPAICGLYYSMTSWKGIGEAKFTGLANYVKLLNDNKYWTSLGRTAVYAVIALPLIMIVSLLLAELMVQNIRGKGIFRAIIYWPAMISYIVVGVAFRFLFGDSTGIINYILELFGHGKVEWLMDARHALAVVIIATVWNCAGYYMIMFMSGLNSIPLSYYEAAKVDGSSPVQSFFRITIPLIRPTIFLVMMLGFLNLFKAYGLVISLTGGGPASATKFVVQYVYETAFSQTNMGYACTESIVLMVILAVFTVLQFRASNGGGAIND